MTGRGALVQVPLARGRYARFSVLDGATVFWLVAFAGLAVWSYRSGELGFAWFTGLLVMYLGALILPRLRWRGDRAQLVLYQQERMLVFPSGPWSAYRIVLHLLSVLVWGVVAAALVRRGETTALPLFLIMMVSFTVQLALEWNRRRRPVMVTLQPEGVRLSWPAELGSGPEFYRWDEIPPLRRQAHPLGRMFRFQGWRGHNEFAEWELRSDPSLLAELVEFYRANPARQNELAGPQALKRIEDGAFRQDLRIDDADPHPLDPPQRGRQARSVATLRTQDSITREPAGQTVVMSEYANARVAYDKPADPSSDPLLEPAATPLELFEQWYGDVVQAKLPEPNAMVLATVDAEGAPCSRTVLLKGADLRGFSFYTNLDSRKARQISAAHGRVALTFPWHGIYRQVQVRGVAQLLDREEVAAYFATRPWGSRVGAWASHQSQPLAARGELEEHWRELGEQWPDTGSPHDVPLPEHWGGYLVRPWEIEFWAGRESRLHDRLVYTAAEPGVSLSDPAAWTTSRRQP